MTDEYIVLSTSFATYKIPRFHFVTFQKARQHEIQNVIGYFIHTYQFDENGSYKLSFYFRDLDDVFDINQFRKFEITRNEFSVPKNMIVV